jgi:hypothetical protein
MNEPTTKAGRWLVDRSDWIDGLRAFRVRINNTAGPDDMRIHVLAIEREAADAERAMITALVQDAADVGIYPKAGPNGPRTPYQDGFNAAAMQIGDALDALLEKS